MKTGSWWNLVVLGCVVAAVSGSPVPAEAAAAKSLSIGEMDTLPLPATGRITGLTFMGPDTLVCLVDTPASLSMSGDRQVQLVFQNRRGKIYFQEEFTGVLDRGLAWDGEFLYSTGDADDGSSIIYKLRTDTLQVDEAFDAPGHRPTAMCYDGRFIWISDRDAGRLDRFDPEAGAITRSAQAPGFSPHGVAWDGRHVWVTDSGTGRLYRLNGSRLRLGATVDVESFLYRDSDVPLLDDGASLWYLPPESAEAIRFFVK